MMVPASPRLAKLASRLRQAVLVLAALFVAHDAIYVARFGVGSGYAQAMTAMGHDAYWAPISILLTIGVTTIGVVGIAA